MTAIAPLQLPPGIDPSLAWIVTPDQHWSRNVEAWRRDEARLFGLDAVLERDELTPFTGEEPTSIDLRKRTARYYNLPDKNASFISGHIIRAIPEIQFGTGWGALRTREELTPDQSLAEVFSYNCDGIGQDGQQFETWIDGVIKRGCATGYRAIMIEMPRVATLAQLRLAAGRSTAGLITAADVSSGWHPYLVEWSPIVWTRRRYTEGTLDEAVIQLLVPSADAASLDGFEQGYYVMTRQGYQGRGRRWEEGGWWLLRQDMSEIAHDIWDAPLLGRIPLIKFIVKHSLGTADRPAFAQSLTTDLGQIAVDLMNARSEQRYNARQAAKTVLFGMGMDPEVQSEVASQLIAGQIVVGVRSVIDKITGQRLIPEMWSSSSAAMDTSVYSAIIKESIDEAEDIMVTQVTSAPESSGESKKQGWSEAVSPFLGSIAANVETGINSILDAYGRRAGLDNPGAVVKIPRKFKLTDLIDDIERMIASLKEHMLTSPTLDRELLLKQLEELGLLDDEHRAVIQRELEESAKRQADVGAGDFWSKVSTAITALTQIGGMTPEGAGFLLGLSDEQVKVLQTGVPPGMQPAPDRAAPTAQEKADRAAALAQRLQAQPGQQGGNGNAPPPSPAPGSTDGA